MVLNKEELVQRAKLAEQVLLFLSLNARTFAFLRLLQNH